MLTEFSLRQAHATDAEAIALLVNAAFRVERFFIAGDRTSPDNVRSLLQSGVFLLAEQSNQLVGCIYIELRGVESREVELQGVELQEVELQGAQGYFGLLAIDPARQKTGWGKRLVKAAEDYCRTAGCLGIELQIVNLRAELPSFYQRLGYRETGTAPFSANAEPLIPCHFVKMSKPL